MVRLRSALLAGVLVAALPAAAPSQGPAFHLGRVFNDGGWTAFGVSWAQRPLGPLSFALGGTMLRGDGASTARLWGADAEVSLFRGGRPGAYAVGGVAGGFGTGGAESWWRSWSAGVGYELIPLPFLSLGIEGRYVGFGASARSGLELSFRVGANLGASAVRSPAVGADLASSGSAPASVAATSLTRSDAQRLLDAVIATADSAIGARYRYGGTGEDGRGFDCSGLIQYAYARHGITLPRTSTEQATQGREIERTLTALQPGDLLTFSSSGRGVTHVGLYVGNGRFIHSASTGVQTSTLSADDPYGKWWFTRWVGVRRIVEGAA
jgi:cell wall-associated NlpC family hydrolase